MDFAKIDEIVYEIYTLLANNDYTETDTHAYKRDRVHYQSPL